MSLNTASTTATNEERGYTITRTFDAPRQLVWDCFTQPQHFAVWFGGHEGRMEKMVTNAVPGGEWSGTMVLPDGTTMAWTGEYREIAEPERLVLAFTVGDLPTFEVFTVTLTDLGATTELVLRQTGGNLPDEEYAEAEHGTGTFLDVLAEHLASLV